MNRAMRSAARARAASQPELELSALKELQRLSGKRDALEDSCAPEGFLAEPILDGAKYANLLFSWAGKPAALSRHRFQAEFTL
jgi:hypothetical protein